MLDVEKWKQTVACLRLDRNCSAERFVNVVDKCVEAAIEQNREERDRERKLIAELVEVCGWALDALLGYEQMLTTYPCLLGKDSDLYKHLNGSGACSIRDLRAVIAKATPKPVETGEKP